jgi:ABC-type uncharacterized transport system permease subunit
MFFSCKSFLLKSWFYQFIGPLIAGGIVGYSVSPLTWNFWVAELLASVLWVIAFHKKMS